VAPILEDRAIVELESRLDAAIVHTQKKPIT